VDRNKMRPNWCIFRLKFWHLHRYHNGRRATSPIQSFQYVASVHQNGHYQRKCNLLQVSDNNMWKLDNFLSWALTVRLLTYLCQDPRSIRTWSNENI
jgi:hypothetical protein